MSELALRWKIHLSDGTIETLAFIERWERSEVEQRAGEVWPDRVERVEPVQPPPGRYAAGARAPIVWVFLCDICAGFAPLTDEGYEGALTGRCQGCGHEARELHRFRAWIDTAPGCNCSGGHAQMHGDVLAKANVTDEPQGHDR
jgi:hypothetical protein